MSDEVTGDPENGGKPPRRCPSCGQDLSAHPYYQLHPSPFARKILVELDDSALGVDLGTRLRSLCDAGSDACAVWIEGTWGRSLPGLRRPEPPPWPVTVRDVGPLVEGSPATIFVAR